jgi:hypothetical protein
MSDHVIARITRLAIVCAICLGATSAVAAQPAVAAQHAVAAPAAVTNNPGGGTPWI